MKRIAAVALFVVATVSFAGPKGAQCLKDCAQVVDMCQKSCEDTLTKNKKRDQIAFCQKQCKDFTKKCEQECNK